MREKSRSGIILQDLRKPSKYWTFGSKKAVYSVFYPFKIPD